MIAESHVLTVQCDEHPNDPNGMPKRGLFSGKDSAEAWTAAKKAGWHLYAAQRRACCAECYEKRQGEAR